MEASLLPKKLDVAYASTGVDGSIYTGMEIGLTSIEEVVASTEVD